MRILVLGGSWFLGRALVSDALGRGWTVTTFNRGRSGTPPEGTELVLGDRRNPEDLARLAQSGPWDATIDTSVYEPGDVLAVLDALGTSIGKYALLSSVSAYRDWPHEPVDEYSLLWPSRVDAAETDPDIAAQSVPAQYGILKAGCELAAGTAPLGTLIFRPGVILGPGEYTGRMLSLFARAQRGGRWLLGGAPSDEIQPVDVRDVSRFVLNRVAIHDEGAYNVVAPREPDRTYGALIEACLEVTSGTAELLWGEPEWLLEQGVREWTEIPLWRTPRGTWAVSGQKAAGAGLHCRSLRETVADTWADFQEHPPVLHPRQAEHGMDPAREAQLLERYDLFRAR